MVIKKHLQDGSAKNSNRKLHFSFEIQSHYFWDVDSFGKGHKILGIGKIHLTFCEGLCRTHKYLLIFQKGLRGLQS